MTELVVVKARLRNTASGSIGWAMRASATTKPAKSAPPAATTAHRCSLNP